MIPWNPILPAAEYRHAQQLRRIAGKLERPAIEAAIDELIAYLDAKDGDTDVELNGDEQDVAGGFAYASPYRPDDRLPEHRDAAAMEDDEEDDAAEADGDERDGSMSEEDFLPRGTIVIAGAGCPLADPDVGVDDNDHIAPGDRSWVEWHTRGRRKLDSFGAELVGSDRYGNPLDEDVEDDDAAEQDDEPEDADSDRCCAGDDHMIAGPVAQLNNWNLDKWEIGAEHDAERSRQRAVMLQAEPGEAA